MNKSFKTNLLPALFCGVLLLNSCNRSSNDPVPVSVDERENSVTVNVNLLEASYENTSTTDVKNTEIHTLLGDIGATEVERILENPESKALADGTTFKVVAYKKSKDKYIWQKNVDLIVGKTNTQQIHLDTTGNYTLVIYSLGNDKALPDLVNQSDFDNAYVDYTNAKDLLYQRIDDFRPSEQNNIDIKFRHELTSLKLKINASDFYGGGNHPNITLINNPRINYKEVSQARFKVSDASKSIISGEKEVSLKGINFNNETDVIKISEWNNIIANTDTNNIVFSADIEMNNGNKYSLNVPIQNIKQGYRQTIKLNLQLCGINLKGGWKQFMCHDLGADYNADPFKADKKLHGDKYQWGYPNFEAKFATSQEDQQNEIIDWRRKEASSTSGDTTKPWAGKDPCPNGYRIPTSKEVAELAELRFNSVGNISTNSGSYESGFALSERGKLFFPASGMRGETDGKIYNRGSEAWIWSSTNTTDNYAYVDILKIPAPNNKSITITQVAGLPIRCVKE